MKHFMKIYKMDCGCKFDILEDKIKEKGKTLEYYTSNNLVPPLKLDIANVPTDCKYVWQMLGKGLTKGVFQLESNLGRQWTKKLMPESVEHLSALGALLRPGCLRSIDAETGLSLTELYCERKNRRLGTKYLHPSLIPILESTYGVLTYQEQAMAIVQAIAGFNLQEADMLRKAIGKKLPEEMAKVEVMFFEGVKKTGIVSEEQAKEIFGWIKESQRYSFNKSHSLSYGINGYWSAYCKAHFPVQFFTSYLRYAKEKADPLTEIRELINEAKLMDIEVLTPDLRSMKKHFFTDGKKIQFGLADVKGIGEAQVDKLRNAIIQAEEIYGKSLAQLSWYDFLICVSPNVQSTTMERLIEVGALSYMDKHV